jgi:hypothetical protein
MTTRARVIAFGSAGFLVVLGVVLGALVGGSTGEVLILVLTGLGLLAATTLAFLEVGLSEDRERARERERRGGSEPGSPDLAARRLPRVRGRRRRMR